jgi:hypothetical protein
MIDWHHLHYVLTPEDRRIRAKWARGVAIVYGSALLLLVALAGAQRIIAEPSSETPVATAHAKGVSPSAQN